MQSSLPLSAMVALLSTWCCLLACQPARAEVDTSSPDLSIFKLQRIGIKELAKQRLGQPIEDMGTGAVHMRESLFVSSSAIRCPAYAHLFKLIRRQESSPDLSRVIRQNVVESLAVVVTYDRIVYYKMFLKSVKQGEAVDDFLEAARALELSKHPHASDAWMDLVDCISEFMLTDPKAASFVRDPERKKTIESVESFKAIATSVDSDRPPAGIAKGLKAKFEAMANSGRDYVSADNYEPAVALINRIEGAEIADLKKNIIAEPVEELAKEPEVPQKHSAPAEAVKPKIEEQIDAAGMPDEVQLVLPSDEGQTGQDKPAPGCDDESIACVNGFSEDQLAILSFIKMRLEMKPAKRYESVPRLSIELALDYKSHWEDLVKAHLNAKSPLGAKALQFRQDPANVKLAETVDAAVGEYVKIVSLIAELRMQSDRIRNIADLKEPIESLGRHLSAISPSYDVDDLRRVHELWKLKYHKYQTVDKFIHADSW